MASTQSTADFSGDRRDGLYLPSPGLWSDGIGLALSVSSRLQSGPIRSARLPARCTSSESRIVCKGKLLPYTILISSCDNSKHSPYISRTGGGSAHGAAETSGPAVRALRMICFFCCFVCDGGGRSRWCGAAVAAGRRPFAGSVLSGAGAWHPHSILSVYFLFRAYVAQTPISRCSQTRRRRRSSRRISGFGWSSTIYCRG